MRSKRLELLEDYQHIRQSVDEVCKVVSERWQLVGRERLEEDGLAAPLRELEVWLLETCWALFHRDSDYYVHATRSWSYIEQYEDAPWTSDPILGVFASSYGAVCWCVAFHTHPIYKPEFELFGFGLDRSELEEWFWSCYDEQESSE